MIDLTPYNTLRVVAKARDLREIREIGEIREIRTSEPYMFLGEGANILFVHDFPGTIIRVDLKGRKVISQNKDEVIVEVAAGENWHEFVTWTVENNWSGIEKMGLIPGTIGAAAVGNIGAYRQEVKDIIVRVITNLGEFTNSECKFDYRGSFFKTNREYLVTAVQFKLLKNQSVLDTYEEIIKIRTQKLPDWTKIGTAGSFFKNPFVTREKYSVLSTQIPDIEIFDNKVHAGKLLDVLGWKGRKIGRVSTYEKHALTIVNLGGATGQEIYDYAEAMREDIRKNFDIELEYEVRII